MEFIRSSVRPIVTVLLTLTLAAMVYQDKPVPVEFSGMVAGVLGWWFYSRRKKP